ncbi:hypothetical protein LTR66_010653 [Elasticomyces elasticus]|nr:hypothetical protein LTR66_010653 [Elasticomyces elasticus]
MASSYGGCLTPPASAYDSRRGSIASSYLCDGSFSGSSSSTVFSPPPPDTPVYGSSAETFYHSQKPESHSCVDTAPCVFEHYMSPSPSQSMFHPAQAQDTSEFAILEQPNFGLTAYAASSGALQNEQRDRAVTWDDQLPTQEYHAGTYLQEPLQPCITEFGSTTLFPGLAPALPRDQSTASSFGSFQSLSSSLGHNTYNLSVPAGFADSLSRSSFYNYPPQSIDPAQAFPESYHELPETCVLSSSFASSTSSYVDVGYSTPLGSDESYVHVGSHVAPWLKEEHYSSDDQADISPRGPVAARSRTKASGVRKMKNKLRKSQKPTKLRRRIPIEGRSDFLELCTEGEWKEMDGGFVSINPEQKKFLCPFISDDGDRCQSRFDRQEHLNRHEKSHVPDYRPYRCPIEGCTHKKSGERWAGARSDNTRDHFKTHLKSKGGRNIRVSWASFVPALRQEWAKHDEEKVEKVIDKLREFMTAAGYSNEDLEGV